MIIDLLSYWSQLSIDKRVYNGHLAHPPLFQLAASLEFTSSFFLSCTGIFVLLFVLEVQMC